MGKIQFTNIIIDDFSIARQNPYNRYVHFLTHIHTDHLKGLSNTWQYGKIYCSSITKQLIGLKFAKLYEHMQELELETQHTIKLAATLQVTVTLFDANHCPGAVMVLIEGYMGTILYTGDIRFDRKTFQEYTYLYPHNKRNKQFKNCSRQIDYLYLDNTFLHPRFTFPPRQKALQILDEFVETIKSKAEKQSRFVDFYIGMDMNGKQQVLVHLANKFQTLIVISQFRFNTIRKINLDCNLFTTNPQQGFIHVVAKSELKNYTYGKQNSMGIILTGWANTPHYRYTNVYAIPYSLHSSYTQLKQFVDSLRPSIIYPIVQSGPRNTECTIQISGLYQEISYHQILDEFRDKYCVELSQQLQELTSNIDLQKKIKQRLGLDRTTQQINMQEFGLKTVQIQRPNNCTGFKLNTDRDEQDIQAVKKTIHQLKKKNLARRMLNTSKSNGSKSNSISYNQRNIASNNLFNPSKMEIQKNQSEKHYPISQNTSARLKNKEVAQIQSQKNQKRTQHKGSRFYQQGNDFNPSQPIVQERMMQTQNLSFSQNDKKPQINKMTIQIQEIGQQQPPSKKLNKADGPIKQTRRSRSRNKSNSKQIQTRLKVKKPVYYVIDDQQLIQNTSAHNQNPIQDEQNQSLSKMKKTILQFEIPQKIVQSKINLRNSSKSKKCINEDQLQEIMFDNSAQMNQIIKNQVSRKFIQEQQNRLSNEKTQKLAINNSSDEDQPNQFFESEIWIKRKGPSVKKATDLNIFQIDESKIKQIKITNGCVDFLKKFQGTINLNLDKN